MGLLHHVPLGFQAQIPLACAIARGTTLSDHYHDSSSSSSLLILPGNLWALLRLSTMLAAYLSTRSKNYKKK